MNDMSRRAMLPPPVAPEEPERLRGARSSGAFGVLDIGTTKIACLIARADSDGELRVLGSGIQKGRGVRGGGITDIEEAERAIRAAVGQAEDMADTRIRAVTVNLNCGQPESRLFNVQWEMGGSSAGRPVEEADIRRVVREGRSRAGTDGREIIHGLPVSFAVDEMTGIADPRGLHCTTLTARLHVIDAAASALRSLATCIARCDLDVAGLVSAPMAAGLATLVADERDLGATVIDMGGGTTGIAVFAEGHLQHTSVLPIGGAHVTNDLARLLTTPLADAERQKTLFGSVHASPDDDREMLTVPLIGEEAHHFAKVPRSMVVSIIRPRMEETFELVKDRLEAAGLGRASGMRVVLTGGACQLGGVREMAAHILGRQVRLGLPATMRGMPDSISGHSFAAAAGMVRFVAGDGRTMQDIDFEAERPAGVLRRIVNFIKERV